MYGGGGDRGGDRGGGGGRYGGGGGGGGGGDRYGGRAIFVGNLPYDVREKELDEIFYKVNPATRCPGLHCDKL